jgi:hypothetical protein
VPEAGLLGVGHDLTRDGLERRTVILGMAVEGVPSAVARARRS